MEFVAIDVETANPNMASICQIGVAHFVDGECAGTHSMLVDPRDWFDPELVDKHGITERDVRGQPTFDLVLPLIERAVETRLVVCHTHFDRVSFSRARAHHGLAPCDWRWLDSARVARRTWPEVAQAGYGLAALGERFGINFRHHDAGEDARACGEVLLRAIAHSGISAEEWVSAINRPITPQERISRTGAEHGPFSGHRFAFTGALQLARADAADLVARMGADVEPSVSKKTTVLVVGDQDISKLAGHSKSGKHRKAEELIRKGVPIRIIGETDFVEMIKELI